MAYNDNPRKIKGKVEIVFADTDISSISSVNVTSEAAISHTNEIYGSSIIPTTKACTMDGNSTMDGTFQMIDDSCVLGWWSGEMASSTGQFATTQKVTITFASRPVSSWTIIGDTKLNQYPVNFTVVFKSNGTTVHTETVTNNTQVTRKVYCALEDITSIEMSITKWSKPNACVKLLNFFDKLSETYEGDDLLSFEINEEMSPEDATYNLNSDTMSVTIYNRDKKFTTGYLKSLLVLDRKVKPYIGIEKNGVTTYTPLGTFYSEEWKIEDDGMWLKCTAVDKLIRLQNKIYVGFNLEPGVPLYYMAEDILVKAGFNSDQYEISDSLKYIYIPAAFIGKQPVWDALQEVANAGLCKVFIDRDDRIIIKQEEDTVEASGITLSLGNSFNNKSNISLTEFANKVSVDYCDVTIADELVNAAETLISVSGSGTLTITIDYSVEVAYSEISIDNANLVLSNFDYGVNACTVTITNISSQLQTGTISVRGNALDITYKTISVRDETSVKDYGEFEYSHPSSELIQTSTQAENIARTILSKLKAGEGVITTTWRGNPGLVLGKSYTLINRDTESTLVCEYNKITYDGGLVQETRGRKNVERT